MVTRRLVTGHQHGTAIVFDDGTSPKAFTSHIVTGAGADLLWATSASPHLPLPLQDAVDRETLFVPAPGETRFFVISFPSEHAADAPDFDADAAHQEALSQIPEIVGNLEPDHPGMHRTQTIDYGIVLDNEITLELDEGREVHLKAGDTFVQAGTRHAWRNRTDKSTRIAFVMVGATRDD